MSTHIALFAKRGLYESFRQSLVRLGWPRDGMKVLVGVSGGRDSMALLHLLLVCGHRVVVGHLNHCLRGRESLADERFVRKVGSQWGVPVIVDRVQVGVLAKKHHMGIEEAARIARYRFLSQVACRRRIGHVMVAHHQQDQAETVLLKILFGTSREHLRGMEMDRAFPVLKWPGCKASHSAQRLHLVRPLLGCSMAEIELYVRQNKIPFRMDSSNVDERHPRNWIRRKLIPMMERGLQRNVVKTLARLGEREEN